MRICFIGRLPVLSGCIEFFVLFGSDAADAEAGSLDQRRRDRVPGLPHGTVWKTAAKVPMDIHLHADWRTISALFRLFEKAGAQDD
jgi:hypothetical protein